MTRPSGELLRLLSGGARAYDASDAAVPRERATLDFGAMLRAAGTRSLVSGLPVRAPIGLSPMPDAAGLSAISRATDLAEAEGIERALVMANGRSYRVDVRGRALIDAPDAHLSAVGGIDGFVIAESTGESAEPPGVSAGPARVVRSASLIDALAAVRPDDD